MNAAAANVQKSKAYTNTWCIGIPPPPPPNLIHSWLNLHNSDINNNNSNVISITPLGTKSTRRRILWTNWLTYYRHNTYILAYTSIFLQLFKKYLYICYASSSSISLVLLWLPPKSYVKMLFLKKVSCDDNKYVYLILKKIPL